MSVMIPKSVTRVTCLLVTPLIMLIGSVYWVRSTGLAKNTATRARINGETLRSGDILFRRGPSVESQAVMTMDGGSTFSHVGIVSKENGATLIVHVVPGEDAPDVTRVEPIEEYLRSDRALAASAFRVVTDRPSQIETAVQFARDYAQRRVPFDSNFDLSSDDALYCTELVWRAYKKAGIDLVDGHFEVSSSSLIEGPVLWPSSLLRSQHVVSTWNWTQEKEK
jgi:uncharacterized protein YycO